jgi:hypothetical protein
VSRGRVATYTAAEDAVLIEHYAKSGAPYCARRLNRTLKQIWGRAHMLGLSRLRGKQSHTASRSAARERFDARALTAALAGWRPHA